MICIYHNRDLDGFASGAIVKRAYPDAKLIGFDYGQTLPLDEIPEGQPIIMVDVSLPMPEMESLAQRAHSQLTWIDHHISAINDYREYTKDKDYFCNHVLENGISACEGAWKFLFPETPIPTPVKLLGQYDTWRNQDVDNWENAVLPFQWGMREVCSSPETFPEVLFCDDGTMTQDILSSGRIILSYQDKQNALLAKRTAFTVHFMGHVAICMNVCGAGSQTFKSVFDEAKHDIMMPFFFNGKQWVYSLYTTKDNIDCSAIAKQNGGGGHKKAAGFQSDSFDLLSKIDGCNAK